MRLLCHGLAILFVVLPSAPSWAEGNYGTGRIRLADASIVARLEPEDVGQSAPALVEFGGRLFMAWRGNQEEYNLVIGIADLRSGNIEEKITFAEATMAAPALAVFQGKLVIAWTGLDGHLRAGRIDYGGRRLESTLRFPDESSTGPALAGFPDRLILGWRDQGSRLHFGRIDFLTGNVEDRVTPSDRKTRAGPALAVSGGTLFVAWTEENRRLSVGTFNGAPHPERNPAMTGVFRNLNESSVEAPALAILDGAPYLGWTGTDSRRRLNVGRFDLSRRLIVGSTTFADGSDEGPALATIGGELAIAWHRSPGGHRQVRIRFPAEAPKICGEIELLNPAAYPPGDRHAVVDLFNIVYPEIVKIYGQPVSDRDVDVKIYHSRTDGSMYLSHKSDSAVKVLAVLIAASLGQFQIAHCVAATVTPDQTLFLSALPAEDGFDHHFTHEIIHAFHDRMDLIGWYDRSWIEEGMTEAAAQLVALRLVRRGGRDVTGQGFKRDPASALKHYDAWSYPWNGAWTGGNPGFSILGGLQFFQGGLNVDVLFSEDGFITNLIDADIRKVLDPDIRYSASASLWLMLTLSLSGNPFEPDFLRRLNEQLRADGVREMPPDSSETIYRQIEKVAGGRTVEGLPVRDWMLQQAILKDAPAGQDFLFIDVRNPDNLELADSPITIYAIAKENLPNPINPLGNLSIGELPARNCEVRVTVRDVNGKLWVDELGLTDRNGKYVVQTVQTLPAGAYAISATADRCDRVEEGPIQSHVPGGLSATTYAVVTSNAIAGPDALVRGAMVRPLRPRFFPGSRPALEVVGGRATGFVFPPFEKTLGEQGSAGAFELDSGAGTDLARPESYAPFLLNLAQATPDGRKNSRIFLKPNPFTRVLWLGTTPDFSQELQPASATVRPGTIFSGAVVLTPNGVRNRELPGCPVFTFLVPGRAPAGVSVELPGGFDRLSLLAGQPTSVPMTIRVSPSTRPGTYPLEFRSQGVEDCEPIARDASFALTVPPLPPRNFFTRRSTRIVATLALVTAILLRRGGAM